MAKLLLVLTLFSFALVTFSIGAEQEVLELPLNMQRLNKSFAIQLVSDLHLEFPCVADKMKRITPKAPYLGLLGDIGALRSAFITTAHFSRRTSA